MMSPDPSSPEPTPASSSRGSLLRHLLFSAALWITFVIYWRIVFGRGVAAEARLSAVLLGLFVALQLLLTLAWIAHNRAISREHAGRRRARPTYPDALTQDFLGRSLAPYPPTVDLTTAAVVTVRVEDGVKRFETGIPLGDARAAASS